MKKKWFIGFSVWGSQLKLWRFMKLTIGLLMSLIMTLSANCYSQVIRLNISLKNITIKELFGYIEQNSEYVFLYRSADLNTSKRMSFEVREASINEILDQALKDEKVIYDVYERQIVIQKSAASLIGTQQQQKRMITGKVSDSNGQPIPGATVLVKGTTFGITTDIDGKFNFPVPVDGNVLMFSFVGMIGQEIEMAGRETFDIAMENETIALDEVVAIGYGTQTRNEISGSVANVSAKDFNKGIIANAADLLQGKVAGLNINKGSGDVTRDATVRLRGTSSLTGSSSPFVVIDGVPGGDLNSVAPQDIESISVLKDASSSAIYGSRSASGVILITTKKGTNSAPVINYEGYVGIDNVTNKPKLLNAGEWRKYAADNHKDVSGFDLGADTDWFGEILRTGVTQNHSLSYSGGDDHNNYMASVNYLVMQGVVKANDLTRVNMRFSINQKAFDDRLLLTFTANEVLGDNSPTDTENFILAYNTIPVVPVKLADGSWYDNTDFDQGNPVRNLTYNKRENKENKFYGNVKADYEISRGLNVSASAFRERNTNDWALYNNSTTQRGRNSLGFAQRQNTINDRSMFEYTLRYKNTLKQVHNITLLAGYSWEESNYRYFGAQNQQFGTDLPGFDNLQAGENLKPGDVYSQRNMSRLISSFARFTYNYAGKYICAATVRRDGSSKFGVNNKWGSFPSFSAAWNMSKENFMSNLTFLNDFKLRIGYGTTGNQDGINSYTSLNLYGQKDKYYSDGQWYTAYGSTQNANPDLKWEKTTMLNFGLDFSLLDNKLSGTIEWYNKVTSDLLYTYNVPVPPYQFNTILANVGSMSNKGIELLLNAIPVRTRDFTWSIVLNAAHNKNMVTQLSNQQFKTDRIKSGIAFIRGGSSTSTHVLEVGHEVGTFFGYQCTGLDSNGKYVFTDLNKDGVIDDKDMTYIGSPQPKLTGSISNMFNYKRWDLSVFIRGVYGNNVLNYSRMSFSTIQWLMGGNVLREALTNGLTDLPIYSSYYIEDGSLLRLENASLGYTFKTETLKWIKKLRLYVSGQNLLTITKYKGLDPEVDMSGLNPGLEGRDYYPKSRTIMIGVNVSL